MKTQFGQANSSTNDKQTDNTNLDSMTKTKIVNKSTEKKATANKPIVDNDRGQAIIGRAHNAQQLLEYVQVTPPPWYYSLILNLIAPFYRLKVAQKAKQNADVNTDADIDANANVKEKEMADRFGERYNKPVSWSSEFDANKSPISPIIWCHAVSLGETNTIAPVLERLLAVGCRVFMTNTTHTGYQRTTQRFAKQIETGQLQQGYVPVDKAEVMERFLTHLQPNLAMFVETELWGNALYQLAKRNIPSVLVNARLSEKSFQGYLKFAQFSRSMMQNIGLILAQDADSARRFRELGADSSKIRVAGSLKWTVNSELASVSDDTSNSDWNDENHLTEMEKSLLLAKLTAEQATTKKTSKQLAKGQRAKDKGLASTSNATNKSTANSTGKKVKSDKYATKKNTSTFATTTGSSTKSSIKPSTESSTATKTASKKSAGKANKKEQPIQANSTPLTAENIKEKMAEAIAHRQVWVVASTHEGEESVALSAHRKLVQLATFADTLLIVVPRHPERFDTVAKQINVSGLRFCRRSRDELPTDETQVYLADSMGELSVWYQLADVAFVGGSMVNVGGHNPVEALAVATPVIMGKYTQSCQMIVDELKHAEVLQQLSNDYQLKKQGKNAKVLDEEQINQLSESLYQTVKVWLNNPERTAELGEKGKQLVADKQSVINRQMQVILDLLFSR